MRNSTFSIITITSDNPSLASTIKSVKSQSVNSNFEHIIIDNLSTDYTKQIVERYQKSVSFPVIYIREKDNGRYEAMNKGIKMATGEYLLFLNAGDSLFNKNVLKKVINYLGPDIIYGDIADNSLANFKINHNFFIDRTLFHQATFIKKDLFIKYGLYDENLIISGDFDFFIKTIIKKNVSTKYLPFVISKYDRHGISSQNFDLVYRERAQVIMRYYTGKQYYYNLFKYLYYKYKKYFPKNIVKYQQKRLEKQPKK